MDICPRCGKPSQKGNLCDTCVKQEQGDTPLREVSVKVCATCKSYFHHNTWVRYTDEKHLQNKILGKTAGTLKFLMTECPKCARRPESNYYEGILQLRNPRNEIVRFIEHFGDRHLARGMFIMKQMFVPNGIDFYVANQKLLMRLGKHLLTAFGGIIKTNAKIHTRDAQKSKDVYRMTVVFQAFPFQRHTLVAFQRDVIEVTQLGKVCYGIDLDTRKRVQLTSAMKLALLTLMRTTVAKIRPQLEVLHPETFESMPVVNPAAGKHLFEGSPADIVVHAGKIYLVTESTTEKKKK